MIEKIGTLPISGNVVEDPNVEETLQLLADKINEMVAAVNSYDYMRALASGIAEQMMGQHVSTPRIEREGQ